VQLVEERVPGWIAEVRPADVGQQRDAVEPEDVERVTQLGERGVDVGQRQHGQPGEALGRRRDELGGALVDQAGELVGQPLVAEEDAGRRQRHDRGVDVVALHELVGGLGGPRREPDGAEHRAPLELGAIVGREDVDVGVDASHAGRAVRPAG
jgi:hypothetical protein